MFIFVYEQNLVSFPMIDFVVSSESHQGLSVSELFVSNFLIVIPMSNI